jgi:hypothetical protein
MFHRLELLPPACETYDVQGFMLVVTATYLVNLLVVQFSSACTVRLNSTICAAECATTSWPSSLRIASTGRGCNAFVFPVTQFRASLGVLTRRTSR